MIAAISAPTGEARRLADHYKGAAHAMSGVETRHISRDSLFLMAELRLEDGTGPHRVKVRNLSSGGMMAEGEVNVVRGARVTIGLRNVGEIDGSIAWVQESRFGVAFVREIDAKAPRSPVGAGGDISSPRFTRPSTIAPASFETDETHLRKI